MSTSYLDRLEAKARGIAGDLLEKVYKAFSNGSPVDAPHYALRGILLDYDDVEEFVFTTKKRLKDEFYAGAYAVVGEFGTGKTQYGFFLKHALEGKDVKVLYRELKRLRTLAEIREEALDLVDKGYNVVVILDNVEAFMSQFEGENEERKAAGRIANLIELLSESPHRTEYGLRGVATIFLLHTDTYRLLQERDERLRRIREIKSLGKLKEPKKGGELALSVLAVLYAYEDACRSAIRKCGDSLVKLLSDWGANLLDVKGSMGKGLFIKTCFNFFRRGLCGLGECPAEATKRGRVVEEFIAEVLEQDVMYVRTGNKVYSARIRRRRGAGPDLEIRLYRRGLPVSAPSLVLYGEVKSVKNSIKHCTSQLKKYASEKKLLLIALAEDVRPVEDEISALVVEAPLAELVYPLPLIEPLTLLRDKEEGARMLRELLGRDLLSDIEWSAALLLASTKPKPAKVVDYRAPAQELIGAAKLRAERAKNVQLGRVVKKVEKGSKGKRVDGSRA